MSGELVFKYNQTGLTVLALILSVDKSKIWTGSAFTAIGSVADIDWQTGMIELVEQTTSDSTGTCRYVGDFPSAITDAGEYYYEVYDADSADPGDRNIGTGSVWWDGAAAYAPPSAAAVAAALLASEGTDAGNTLAAAIAKWNDYLIEE